MTPNDTVEYVYRGVVVHVDEFFNAEKGKWPK